MKKLIQSILLWHYPLMAPILGIVLAGVVFIPLLVSVSHSVHKAQQEARAITQQSSSHDGLTISSIDRARDDWVLYFVEKDETGIPLVLSLPSGHPFDEEIDFDTYRMQNGMAHLEAYYPKPGRVLKLALRSDPQARTAQIYASSWIDISYKQ